MQVFIERAREAHEVSPRARARPRNFFLRPEKAGVCYTGYGEQVVAVLTFDLHEDEIYILRCDE